MSEKPESQKRQTEGRPEGLGRSAGRKSLSAEAQGYQTVGSRRAFRAKQSERTLAAMGLALVAVMLLSVVACLWFGWRINHNLDRLARLRQEFTKESAINQELITRRDSLLTKKTITRKAAVLGLFPPTEKQLRRP